MDDNCTTKLGCYRLLALLATGGMAEIHLAQQTGIKGFERLVVLKKILPHLARDEVFLEMFFDEARIAAQLSHPNIVQIYDLGQDKDEFFIAMEFLEGESLAYLEGQARKQGKTLPEHLSAGILAQVCDGLEYAHSFCAADGRPLNIVHRDISPQNIIVLFSGAVKLVDFGIAKAASQMHQTRAGTMKGKLAYMSPEQVLGKSVDRRTDVFSLGIIFWELLARRRLFKRDNDGAMLQAIISEEIPSTREIRFKVPRELDDIALRALQRDPGHRFKSAAEMGQALRNYLRESGRAAGNHEIGGFVTEVLGERAATKKILLERIRTTNGELSQAELLKAESSDSMPSRSRIENLMPPTIASAAVPPIPQPPPPPPVTEPPPPGGEPPPAEPLAPAGPSARRRLPLVAGAGILAAGGAVLAILWALFAGDSAGESPASADTGLVAPAVAPAEVPVVPLDQSSAEPQKTSLSVHSRPTGCRIVLNGMELARPTPVEKLDVFSGVEHRVVVLCPRHEEQIQTFTGEAGGEVLLEFTPSRLASDAAQEYGYLRLDTQPWSEIYLGKRLLGVTPILKLRIKAGRHRLLAVNQSAGIRQHILVDIRPGKTTKLIRELAK